MKRACGGTSWWVWTQKEAKKRERAADAGCPLPTGRATPPGAPGPRAPAREPRPLEPRPPWAPPPEDSALWEAPPSEEPRPRGPASPAPDPRPHGAQPRETRLQELAPGSPAPRTSGGLNLRWLHMMLKRCLGPPCSAPST